ncbi:MAG: DUF4920 domain-containing protein, partial [Bacteroidota bacterium]
LFCTILIVGCSTSINYEVAGTDFTGDYTVSTSDLLKMEGLKEQSILVEGVVKDVCLKKGCWMTLETADSKNVRVVFKDYGFFVPTDLTGAKVVIDGIANEEVISEDAAKHYAEDGGYEYKEEQRKAITIIATGVKYEKAKS